MQNHHVFIRKIFFFNFRAHKIILFKKTDGIQLCGKLYNTYAILLLEKILRITKNRFAKRSKNVLILRNFSRRLSLQKKSVNIFEFSVNEGENFRYRVNFQENFNVENFFPLMGTIPLLGIFNIGEFY